MKTTSVLVIALTLLCASFAFAKRSAPAEVAPVKSDGIEYRAPHGQMGCVEAWDATAERLVWRRQVYVVRYDVALERDVQDVFIKSIELMGNRLLVKNERGSEYQLDLASLEVQVEKGLLVETVKP